MSDSLTRGLTVFGILFLLLLCLPTTLYLCRRCFGDIEAEILARDQGDVDEELGEGDGERHRLLELSSRDRAVVRAASSAQESRDVLANRVERLENVLASAREELERREERAALLTARAAVTSRQARDDSTLFRRPTREFDTAGRQIYGDAWDQPPPGGGLSVREALSIDPQLRRELSREARQILRAAGNDPELAAGAILGGSLIPENDDQDSDVPSIAGSVVDDLDDLDDIDLASPR